MRTSGASEQPQKGLGALGMCPLAAADGCSLAAQDGAEGLRLNKELIPDALHPNALGQDRVFTCLEPHLAPYLPLKSTAM